MLQLSTVQALLGTRRVRLDERDSWARSALLHAAHKHDAATMRLLLAGGAGVVKAPRCVLQLSPQLQLS